MLGAEADEVAKRVCEGCPVQERCLEYALRNRIDHGVWGGCSERQRRWSGALVEFALGEEGNRQVLEDWLTRWVPLGDRAIDAWCAALPGAAESAAQARAAAATFRTALGLSR